MAAVLRSLTLSGRSATTAGLSRRLICNAASDHQMKLAKNSGGMKKEVSATVNSEVQSISWGRLFSVAVVTYFSSKLGGSYANSAYERSLFEGVQLPES